MTSSGHRQLPGYLTRHGKELRALFSDAAPKTVLDIGCGDGHLYAPLGFDQVEYRGVDFSPSMLECFRARYPGSDLVCCDGSAYRDERKYDLIISVGMIQFFDDRMMNQLLQNVRSMMRPDSTFVIACTPCKAHRAGYLLGQLAPPWHPSGRARILGWVRLLLRWRDPMGRWFNPSDLIALASQNGFSCEIFGSSEYLYRIHCVLRLSASNG